MGDIPIPCPALEVRCSGRARLCAAPGFGIPSAPSPVSRPPPPCPSHSAASLYLFVLALSLTLYLIIHRREAASRGPRSLITAALVSAGGASGSRAGEMEGAVPRGPLPSVPPGAQQWVHSSPLSQLPNRQEALEGRSGGAP